MQRLKTFCVFNLIFILFYPIYIAKAQSSEVKLPAVILKVLKKTINNDGPEPIIFQTLEAKLEKSEPGDKNIIVENNNAFAPGSREYSVGDNIFVIEQIDSEGKFKYFAYDYNRLNSILTLFIIFIFFTILIAKFKGLNSLIAMALSFLVIFFYLLPQILSGTNSFITAIITAIIIIPLTFCLSHGLNHKTAAAMLSTVITLIFIGIFATIAVEMMRLTGNASEDVNFLIAEKNNLTNVKDLLLAGIIIGLLGILDDITISQSSIVFKLKEVSPNLKPAKLFTKAMDIGRDHIASVVNTLILVYAGAYLPLLLLFLNNSAPFTEIINEEFMAEEVVRTLTGSIGVIIAVPITTLIATWFVYKFKITPKAENLNHLH